MVNIEETAMKHKVGYQYEMEAKAFSEGLRAASTGNISNIEIVPHVPEYYQPNPKFIFLVRYEDAKEEEGR